MMFNERDIKALKKLVEKYRSVTLEQIEKEWDDNGSLTMRKITGFGQTEMCTVCKAAEYENSFCIKCFWSIIDNGNFIPCIEAKTYNDIADSLIPQDCLKAVKARADYIEKMLKKYIKED